MFLKIWNNINFWRPVAIGALLSPFLRLFGIEIF